MYVWGVWCVVCEYRNSYSLYVHIVSGRRVHELQSAYIPLNFPKQAYPATASSKRELILQTNSARVSIQLCRIGQGNPLPDITSPCMYVCMHAVTC